MKIIEKERKMFMQALKYCKTYDLLIVLERFISTVEPHCLFSLCHSVCQLVQKLVWMFQLQKKTQMNVVCWLCRLVRSVFRVVLHHVSICSSSELAASSFA